MKRWALFLATFSIMMAAGSAHAWPRAGMAGHFSHGPAWNRGPVAEQGAKIDVPGNSKNGEDSSEHFSGEPMETGNLPEDAESRSYADRKMEDGKKLDRQYNWGP